MRLIELGIIDYKIIIPLIYPFLYQIRGLFHKDEDKPIFMCFTNFFGYLISGIIYLIIKWRMRRNKNNDLENGEKTKENIIIDSEESPREHSIRKISFYNLGDNLIKIETDKIRKKRLRNQYLFILLLVIIYLIPMFLDSYVSSNSDSYLGTSTAFSLFFFIFFNILLSRIILGQKIYLHQFFSSIIIAICIIIVIIIIFVRKINFSSEELLNLVLVIIVTALYTLFNVLAKKYYNIYMDSPYHFMFIIGLFASSLILLYEIITVLIYGKNTNFNGIFHTFGIKFDKYGGLYVLVFIGDILSAFIWLAGIQLTVYFFTPCHFIISESISQIITTIINSTWKDFYAVEIVFIYIFFVIILFAAFIYNEIIIINVCNFNKDTNKNISKRQLSETEEILIKLKDIEKEFDDKVATKKPTSEEENLND